MKTFGLGRASGLLILVTTTTSAGLFLLGRTQAGAVTMTLSVLAITAFLIDIRRRLRGLGGKQMDASAMIRDLQAEVATCTRVLSRVSDEVRAARRELRDTNALHSRAKMDVENLQRLVQTKTGALGETLDRLERRGQSLDATAREILYTTHMVPQDVEAQTRLQALTRDRAPLPPTGGWGMDARNLLAVMMLIGRAKPTQMVELGSGASTVWLGYALQRIGSKLLSLEHLGDFAQEARRQVVEHGLEDTVEVRLSPLRSVSLDGEDLVWYDPTALSGVGPVDLVLVDGPPKGAGHLSRYPALPVLLPLLANEAWIVLDDARRPDERETLRRWVSQFAGVREVKTSNDDIALLRYRRIEQGGP